MQVSSCRSTRGGGCKHGNESHHGAAKGLTTTHFPSLPCFFPTGHQVACCCMLQLRCEALQVRLMANHIVLCQDSRRNAKSKTRFFVALSPPPRPHPGPPVEGEGEIVISSSSSTYRSA